MIHKILPKQVCPTCGETFQPKQVNQKYCSVFCREKHYENSRKEYYQKNKVRIRKQQKKYNERKKVELLKMMKEAPLPLYLCKLTTDMIRFTSPVKNYNYNETYDLWTITSFKGDTYFIYSKNIKNLEMVMYDEDERKMAVGECKKGQTTLYVEMSLVVE